jgi:glutamate racemase
MIVVACNTSASHALMILRKTFPVPIVGVIEPGVKKAVCVTQNKTIGVIATPATINSQAYARKIKETDRAIKVFSQACPLFVPLVEEGWFTKDVTLAVAKEYLQKFKKTDVDTLILGCTHYPLLKTVLRKVMGPRVTLVDSAQEVAYEVRRVLEKTNKANTKRSKPRYRFLVSDQPQHFCRSAKRFLGYDIQDVKRVM